MRRSFRFGVFDTMLCLSVLSLPPLIPSLNAQQAVSPPGQVPAGANPAPAAPVRDPQAVAILNGSLQAMGVAQLRAAADVQITGTLSLPSAPDSVAGTFVDKARGSDFSIETERSGTRTSYRVLAGTGSLKVNSQVRALPQHITSGEFLDVLPQFSRWVEFGRSGASVKLVGDAKIGGTSCKQIRVESDLRPVSILQSNEHANSDVFVDSQVGLILAVRYEASVGQSTANKVELENQFSDYRNFGGVLIPTRVTRIILGQPVLILRVTQVHFNNGFGDSDFRN